MRETMPENVEYVIAALKQQGVDSWVIGGAVRDSLLGRDVHDWDLTAAGMPEQILQALPGAKPIGGEYGTVTWHGVEITPCRAESDYTDHRHPDVITFGTDLRVDLSRRDFTVNAMAWDGQVIIDPYRGRYDLKDKVLRAVGEPSVRFTEDALRILRLYRFAGVLGFSVEEKTGMAALTLADSLQYVSVPRIRNELEKALKGEHPSALAPLIAVGALHPFSIEGEFLAQTDSASQALAPLDAVPASLLCRWWALLHLTHSSAYHVAKVFQFGKTFVKDFAKLDEFYAAGMPQSLHALKQMLCDGLAFSFLDVAETFAAVDARFATLPQLYRQLVTSEEPYLKEHLAITPTALLAMGVSGRALGELQRCLLKAVIDTPDMNKETTLLNLARELKELV